jgi:hypothetical protein
MKIKKITCQNEKRDLRIKGQGCLDDCKSYAKGKSGVTGKRIATNSAVITGLW